MRRDVRAAGCSELAGVAWVEIATLYVQEGTCLLQTLAAWALKTQNRPGSISSSAAHLHSPVQLQGWLP